MNSFISSIISMLEVLDLFTHFSLLNEDKSVQNFPVKFIFFLLERGLFHHVQYCSKLASYRNSWVYFMCLFPIILMIPLKCVK